MIINMLDAVIADSQNRGGRGSEPQPLTESPVGAARRTHRAVKRGRRGNLIPCQSTKIVSATAPRTSTIGQQEESSILRAGTRWCPGWQISPNGRRRPGDEGVVVKPGQRGESPSRTQRPASQEAIRPSPLPYKPRHCCCINSTEKS